MDELGYYILLHICQNIRDCGPPQTYWQLPAEQAYGMMFAVFDAFNVRLDAIRFGYLYITRGGEGRLTDPNLNPSDFGGVP